MNNERAENNFINKFVTNLNKDLPYLECSVAFAFLWNIQVFPNKFQNLFTVYLVYAYLVVKID